ncbi:MAG: type III pantothenate kinase [Saprospiraceae bacterium]
MQVITDIGNSDVVFGIYDNDEWKYLWRTASDRERSADDFKSFFSGMLSQNDIGVESVDSVVLSSVVPSLTPVILEMLASLFDKKIVVVNASIYSKINVKITTNENEIGTDLVANAVAGYNFAKGACIIVDFGTALTFTSINNDGYIQGVAIAPGIKTAMKALASNAAQLPEIPLELPKSVIGKDTIHAIQAGILHGYIGLVRGILNQTKSELGECKIVATGGLSHILKPLHSAFDLIDKSLTINGLRLIGEMINS